ncbi:adenylate cyclase [Gonapodya sp. JEL0774]|nr:adenylate cyclase [Gonapodya sp. JEL0774]
MSLMDRLPTDERALFNGSVKGFYYVGIAVFLVLQFLQAPFGRFVHNDTLKSLWGPRLNGRIAWAIQETVPLVVFPLIALRPATVADAVGKLRTVSPLLNPVTMVLSLMYWGHYIHRGIIFPLNSPGSSPSNLFVMSSAAFHNVVMAYIQARGITIFGDTIYANPRAFFDPRTNPTFFLGLFLYIVGIVSNITSDYHLFHLRRNPPPGQTVTTASGSKYSIPTAGLHRYLAAPGYVTEILQWTGYAIATGGHAWGWSFPFFTAMNLVPRAVATDKWYKDTFGARNRSSSISTVVPNRPPFQEMLHSEVQSSTNGNVNGNGVSHSVAHTTAVTPGKASIEDTSVLPQVARFQTYLRINTAQPKPDYDSATAWFKTQAEEIGLDFRTYDCVPGKTFSILTFHGTDPTLPTLFLNSHIDVVPVDEQYWTVPPFAAVRRPNGDIVARGAQDMKVVGVQYLESIRILKSRGWVPRRTIHVCFTPDEEIGGVEGMGPFVKSEFFKQLNVGFGLDEGISNPGDVITVFYAERTGCHTLISTHGNTGHGSQFISDSGTEKLLRIIAKFNEFRAQEETRLKVALGDVTTPNLVLLKCGNAPNIVPGDAQALYDIRVSPRTDYYAFRAQLESWAASEPGVHLTFYGQPTVAPLPDLDAPPYDVYWRVLQDVAGKRGVALEPRIFPAGSDARFVRQVGIPALGVSYLKNTPVLLHDHDEYVNEKLFLEGIDFYVDLLPRLVEI